MEITYTKNEEVKGELSKPTVHIEPVLHAAYPGKYSYCADVRFTVNGQTLTLTYGPDQWNEFWNNFNSGNFLIEELKKKYNLDSLVIPNDIEDWFVNK
jgi:hypothetical protein